MNKIFLLAFALVAGCATMQNAGDEIRLTVLAANRRAGFETSRFTGLKFHVHYEYDDRKRGPSFDADGEINEHGVPVRWTQKGVSYFKIPVNDRYEVKDGTAKWETTLDSGSAPAGPNSFFGIPAPEGEAILARALLASASGEIPFLPGGRAKIERLKNLELKNGKRVTLYAISGLGFEPSLIWLDESNQLFFSADGFIQNVRTGWEDEAPKLIAEQDAAMTERRNFSVQKLFHRVTGRIIFDHVNVFDSIRGRVLKNMRVVVDGDKIAEVAEAAKSLSEKSGALVIDGRGKTLLPGLWDMHQHMEPSTGLFCVAGGVTTVRDLGNDIDRLSKIKNEIDTQKTVGPRIISAGLIDGKGPLAAPAGLFVETPDEAEAAVDRYYSLGYEQIKIYSSVKPELVPVIIARAKSHKMRVSGHIPAFMNAEQAVREGFDEIQHINMLFLNFMRDVQDTRGPVRFTAVGDRAGAIDIKSRPVQEFLELLREKHTVIDSTISVFEGMYQGRRGVVLKGWERIAERYPVNEKRGLMAPSIAPEGKEKIYSNSYDNMIRFVGEMDRHGITLVAGTDDVCGYGIHRELETYVAGGLSPIRALQTATINSARVMHREDRLGAVEKNKKADLVLVDGHPDIDIKALQNVSLVVKDGVIFYPAEIETELGMTPRPSKSSRP